MRHSKQAHCKTAPQSVSCRAEGPSYGRLQSEAKRRGPPPQRGGASAVLLLRNRLLKRCSTRKYCCHTDGMAPDIAPIPLLMDDSGYQMRQSDLVLVGVPNEDLAAVLDGKRPLGMSKEVYEEFVRSLLYALRRDRVDVADVRVQGSSVNFFSGRHKFMPYERE